jgi:hypothetical protein
MKTGVVIWLVLGGIGLIAPAIGIRLLLDNWRKKAIAEAGESFGFRRPYREEGLPIVMVPLLDFPGKKYFLILRGAING